MRAGKLNTRCDFDRSVKIPNGGGGEDLDWTFQFWVWGALVMPSLRAQQEAIAAGAKQSVTVATITVPEDSGTTALIDATWRVTAEGRVWNILEVRPPIDRFIRMSVETGSAI
ncbi:MAG: phage head closure protein [Pseudomonadota bacterium]